MVSFNCNWGNAKKQKSQHCDTNSKTRVITKNLIGWFIGFNMEVTIVKSLIFGVQLHNSIAI
jgi:hypothetical protein